jgi:glycosyltransferase involved in cell wall biosynthesis
MYSYHLSVERASMVRATFVMEQHLGHQTYYQNIRAFVDNDTQVQATWVLVTYEHTNGVWEHITFLPQRIRDTLTGRHQVQIGLKQTASDVVFFNTQVPAVLAGKLAQRRPYAISTDLTPIQYDQFSLHYRHHPDRPGLRKIFKHRMNVLAFRGATQLFPWSNWARQSLISDYGVDSRKIEVIPPGVDIATWIPAAKNSTGPLCILFVGGDLYRKGGDLLLQAFRSLAPGSAKLILVTKTQVPAEPGVYVYNNLQPNSATLRQLFQTSDVFVLPTAAEAFGIAAIEAGAAGLAAIVTAVGGLTDIVVDGENGFVIQPGDVQSLSERLRLLASDAGLRERMGKVARQRVETYFDARRNAERIVSRLLEVARKDPNAGNSV